MAIQWSPGHMYKAKKEIEATLSQVDVVIEILDARLPASSENPIVRTLRGDKPCVKVLNKCDLAEATRTDIWQQEFESERATKTLAVTKHQPHRVKLILDVCQKLVPIKAKRGDRIRAMIMGIPNVGKSTVINILADRNIANTGDVPGVTRHQQRTLLKGGIELIDTPGMLWPKFAHPAIGFRLAVVGAVSDSAISYEEVAYELAEFLLADYPKLLMARFGFEETPAQAMDLIEALGRKRGCIRSGGRIDLERASKMLVNELRSGSLGRVTLETPEAVEKEQRLTAEQRA